VLEQTLEEEKATDLKLTELSDSEILSLALAAGAEMEESAS
jgi:hypothetical protein